MNENDHDLLIQIGTKLDRAILDIKELKDNTTSRVTALESEKLNWRDFVERRKNADMLHGDHEKRLRRLERWGFLALGALGIIEIITNLYVAYFRK